MTTWVEDLLAKAKGARTVWVTLPNGVKMSQQRRSDVVWAFDDAADPPTVQRLCQLLLDAEKLLGDRRPGNGYWDHAWHYDADDWLTRLREGG